MKHVIRHIGQVVGSAVLIGAICVGVSAQDKSRDGAATRSTQRTAWGHPDLQGSWTNTTTTPLERPTTLAGKTTLTQKERADLDEQAAGQFDRPPRPGDTGAYNAFWFERG